jgi:hypothetical protein
MSLTAGHIVGHLLDKFSSLLLPISYSISAVEIFRSHGAGGDIERKCYQKLHSGRGYGFPDDKIFFFCPSLFVLMLLYPESVLSSSQACPNCLLFSNNISSISPLFVVLRCVTVRSILERRVEPIWMSLTNGIL